MTGGGAGVVRLDRRELVHVNVTDHPTAAWAAHQLVESFPEDIAPKYLLREGQPPTGGRIVAISQAGGLHHRYQRAA